MKKNLITVLAIGFTLSISSVAYAQTGRVGINTADPKSTLDVNGQKDSYGNLLTTDMTGLQAPRLTRKELATKGNTLYGTDQKGALVYITDVTGGDVIGQRVNVTSVGYYYFDGSFWIKIQSGNNGNNTAEPWKIQNTSTDATANDQNIYQQGKVAVGFKNTDNVSGKQFEVKGDMKSLATLGSEKSEISNTYNSTLMQVITSSINSGVNVRSDYNTMNILGPNAAYSEVFTGLDNAYLRNEKNGIYSYLFLEDGKATFRFTGADNNTYTLPIVKPLTNQAMLFDPASPTGANELKWQNVAPAASNDLSGKGNAYACINPAGQIFRSTIPCTL